MGFDRADDLIPVQWIQFMSRVIEWHELGMGNGFGQLRPVSERENGIVPAVDYEERRFDLPQATAIALAARQHGMIHGALRIDRAVVLAFREVAGTLCIKGRTASGTDPETLDAEGNNRLAVAPVERGDLAE